MLPLAYNVRSFEVKYLSQVDNEWKDEWDTRAADTPYFLPRAVQIGLVLIASSTDDPDETEDVPFLTTVELEYAPRLPRTSNNSDIAAAQAAGANTVAGQSITFDTNKFNKGGFGGTGASGLASGMDIPKSSKGTSSPGKARQPSRPQQRSTPGMPANDVLNGLRR